MPGLTDGGRAYQQLASYTNDAQWNHCVLTILILDPYRQWILHNNAARCNSIQCFPYGMVMNYWRTGDTTNAAAIRLLATNGIGGTNYG